MSTVNISVPADLKHKMEEYEIINWSAVAREAFAEKIRELEFIKKFKADSTLTEEDAVRIGREMRKGMAGRRN